MHLEYQDLLREHPGLAERLEELPGASVLRSRARIAPAGLEVVLTHNCRGPRPRPESATPKASEVFSCATRCPLSTPRRALSRSKRVQPVGTSMTQTLMRSMRLTKTSAKLRAASGRRRTRRVAQSSIRPNWSRYATACSPTSANGYEKAAQVPADAPRPRLDCWMELN